MRVLVLLFLLVSNLSLAQTAPMDQLHQLDKELTVLVNDAKTSSASASAKDVLKLQFISKNDELRQVLQGVIDNRSEDSQKLLLTQVNQQIVYIADGLDYLSEKIKLHEKNLESATSETRLQAQKNLDDTRRFSIRMLSQQWTNYQWLKLLDAAEPEKQQSLVADVQYYLEFISTSLTLDSQQEEMFTEQLTTATKDEKSALQLDLILAQRKAASNVESLQLLVELADEMALDTTIYKQQLFEVTGTLTDELLNTDVILSIISTWGESATDWLLDNAPELLFKVLIFVAIIFLFRWFKKIVRKMVERGVSSPNLKMSQLMQDFFVTMSGNVIFAIGLMIALAQIGVDLTPILTGFGVAGLVIGFALQDTLSNFASGMMLLIYRPFDVGDFVEAGGVSGKVGHMSLVNTTIRTFDNQVIIVPNSKIWGDTIINVTHEKVRRVDMVFGIGYSDDIPLAEKVLADIVLSHAAVLKHPETIIKLHTLNTSSVDFIVRPWVKTEDYWDVYWDITREVKMRFDKEGLSIPFPQQDVHLHMVDKKAD